MFVRPELSDDQKIIYYSLRIGKLNDILKACHKELNEIKWEIRKDHIESSLGIAALAIANLPAHLKDPIDLVYSEYQAHLKVAEILAWVVGVAAFVHYSYRVFTAPKTRLADLFKKYQWNSVWDDVRSNKEDELFNEVEQLIGKIYSDQIGRGIYLKQDYELLIEKIGQLQKVYYSVLEKIDPFIDADKVNQIIKSSQPSFLSDRTVDNPVGAMKALEEVSPNREFSVLGNN